MIKSISEKSNDIVHYLQDNNKYLFLFCFVLMIPAFFINLGLIDFFLHNDESTRTLVALEMYLSHDFITPTINGINYLNKPPLYNWILVLFAKVCGEFNEFSLRLPSTLSLFGLGLTVFYFVKKEYGKQFALITALMIITCGRVLFWESFFSIIDFSFSLAVYAGIMVIYFYYKRNRFLEMFMVSYALAAVAFMMKGLPAIVFQGITLVVLLGYEKKIRKLFTIEHLIGIAVFAIITGCYYLIYLIKNPESTIFSILLDESIKRTLIQKDGIHAIKLILQFPFDMFYHYLPWSLFIVFLFRKGFWKIVNNEPFLKFNLFVFFANLLVYWTSPDVYPKYILMLMPMLFTVCWYFARIDFERRDWKASIMGKIVLILMVVFFAGPFVFAFFRDVHFIEYYNAKTAFLIIVNLIILFLFIKIRKQRIILTIAFMLLIRIAFDWFIWPTRYDRFIDLKNEAIEVANITKNKNVYYYPGTKVNRATSFYISREKKQIIRFKRDHYATTDFCIVDKESFEVLKQTKVRYRNLFTLETLPLGTSLYLIGFNQ